MDFAENSERRRIALRELLTRAQVPQGARLAGPGFIRTEYDEAERGDEMDVASGHAQAATNARLSEHQWSTHAALDQAIKRFHLGLYGFCEDCSEEISLERLRAVPLASYCIDCQSAREMKVVQSSESERLIGLEPIVHSSDEHEVVPTGRKRGPSRIRLASTHERIGSVQRKHAAATG